MAALEEETTKQPIEPAADPAASSAVSTGVSTPAAAAAATSAEKHLISLFRGLQRPSAPLDDRSHPFWDTQPVPKRSDPLPSKLVGPMDKAKTVDDIRAEPYNLPEPFHWVTCNINDDTELTEIYSLLNLNYVEDDDNMFRFDYSKEFLRWALGPPEYNPDWHIGVRTDKGKLVAFISGVPASISVYNSVVRMAEINFLCVHKKLRSKRLAPVLIKEVTRRVNRCDMWQAVYTAGILLTKPVSECTYFHRSLNIKKLVDVRFTGLGPRTTLSMAKKIYKLPDSTQTSGLRPMKLEDIPTVLKILNKKFQESTDIFPVFTEEEAAHVLLPRDNVVVSYVREKDGEVTDFFSFYILPSSIIGDQKYKTLYAAYAFYSAAVTVPLTTLINDALIVARDKGMDVFNALNLSENDAFIRELKFGKGDGSLRYYLYNYLCPAAEPDRIGLIML